MTTETLWLKPYSTPEQGEEIRSIVAYSKVPWVGEWKDMGDGRVREFVTVWSRQLHINLWFVVIRITWTTGEKATL